MLILHPNLTYIMNIAIILAGGSGSRLGGDLPKQFLKVAGKTIIEHSIGVFDTCSMIDEIAIVSRQDYIQKVEDIVARDRYSKVRHVLPGGKERYHSSLSALNAYKDDDDNLLFHDAVRPLVTHRIIADCVEALGRYNAVNVAVPTTDTIVQVDDADCITDIPLRKYLRNSQTPQCFKRRVIARAYELALQDPDFTTTDDCGVVRRYLPDEPVYVVDGDTSNMKLTYKEDLFLFEHLLKLRMQSGEPR